MLHPHGYMVDFSPWPTLNLWFEIFPMFHWVVIRKRDEQVTQLVRLVMTHILTGSIPQQETLGVFLVILLFLPTKQANFIINMIPVQTHEAVVQRYRKIKTQIAIQ